jgi:hypothetical protein
VRDPAAREAIEDRTGYAGEWSVTAYATCVDR